MKLTRCLTSLTALVAVVLVASCDAVGPTANAPPTLSTSAVPTSAAELLGGGFGELFLLRCSPLPTDSASALIGPSGGTIDVGPHRLTVPAGALDSEVTITAVAPSGNVNLVRFEPEGLQFGEPARLTMSYANCGLLGWLLPRHILHVDDEFNILDILPALGDRLALTVSTDLEHFSDYAVAW